MLKYTKKYNVFYWYGPAANLAGRAGFDWHSKRRVYITSDPYRAFSLIPFADSSAANKLSKIWERIHISETRATPPAAPAGLEYKPYQVEGIPRLVERIKSHGYTLLADEQGLGKTVQAIGAANELGARRLLVVCPAHLRINWRRELEKWHLGNPGIDVVLTSKTQIRPGRTVITSYNLAAKLRSTEDFDLAIVDEAQYLKSYSSKRTGLLIGNHQKNGILQKIPTIFLTGTPLPNGRPSEILHLLQRCAPDVLAGMTAWEFLQRYTDFQIDDLGRDIIKGTRNEGELFNRLRGSGFMVRRKKEDVLKDLPPKRFHLVVFPKDSKTRKVLKKESAYDIAELLNHKNLIGSALPEIRREMGLAKLPVSLKFIKDLLDGGTQKLLVFGYHQEVLAEASKELKSYGAVIITGKTTQPARQKYVDRFQTDPACRILIGNLQAAGTGYTLTAAHDVALLERSWVPGENDQCVDRAHRIGQTERVNVWDLVVEGSIDFKIAEANAGKAISSKKILDN